MNQGYYNQAPQGYYGQQQGYVPNAAQANAMVNPMQAPTYGVNPMAANQQFVSQANMMMNGTVAPVYAAPQQPVVQPEAPVVTPQVAPQAEATVTSEKKIEL
jgi:hypothetical protein